MRYISIDVETTGLDNKQNVILEIGAVIADTDNNDVNVKDLPTFRGVVVTEERQYLCSYYIMQMHDKLFQEIEAVRNMHKGTGLNVGNDKNVLVYGHPNHIVEQFSKWAMAHDAYTDKGKIIAAGKNFFGFDIRFLEEFHDYFVGRFHHRCLDPLMLYIRPDDTKPPSLAQCCERADMTLENHHTAVGDAQTVVSLIRARLLS